MELETALSQASPFSSGEEELSLGWDCSCVPYGLVQLELSPSGMGWDDDELAATEKGC